jgi:hypothetical protein
MQHAALHCVACRPAPIPSLCSAQLSSRIRRTAQHGFATVRADTWFATLHHSACGTWLAAYTGSALGCSVFMCCFMVLRCVALQRGSLSCNAVHCVATWCTGVPMHSWCRSSWRRTGPFLLKYARGMQRGTTCRCGVQRNNMKRNGAHRASCDTWHTRLLRRCRSHKQTFLARDGVSVRACARV